MATLTTWSPGAHHELQLVVEIFRAIDLDKPTHRLAAVRFRQALLLPLPLDRRHPLDDGSVDPVDRRLLPALRNLTEVVIGWETALAMMMHQPGFRFDMNRIERRWFSPTTTLWRPRSSLGARQIHELMRRTGAEMARLLIDEGRRPTSIQIQAGHDPMRVEVYLDDGKGYLDDGKGYSVWFFVPANTDCQRLVLADSLDRGGRQPGATRCRQNTRSPSTGDAVVEPFENRWPPEVDGAAHLDPSLGEPAVPGPGGFTISWEADRSTGPGPASPPGSLVPSGEKWQHAGVFWPSLSTSEQAAIEAVATRRVYRPGARLLGYNENTTSVMIVLEGQLKLTRSSVDGQTMVIELRGPGSLLGELAALDQGRRIASGIAVTEVQALIVPAHRFRELLLEHSGICFAALVTVADKLRQATGRLSDLSSSDVLTRLAGRLLELGADRDPRIDGSITIDSPLTQQELADWIGASREAVVLALGTMRTRGWIETGRRTIRILDLPALRQAADPGS